MQRMSPITQQGDGLRLNPSARKAESEIRDSICKAEADPLVQRHLSVCAASLSKPSILRTEVHTHFHRQSPVLQLPLQLSAFSYAARLRLLRLQRP